MCRGHLTLEKHVLVIVITSSCRNMWRDVIVGAVCGCFLNGRDEQPRRWRFVSKIIYCTRGCAHAQIISDIGLGDYTYSLVRLSEHHMTTCESG